MLNKRWKIREVEDDKSLKALADSLNISEVLAKLLFLREIKTFSQAKFFFRPTIESLHNPFLMNGMEAATKRVIRALTENQPICIYGDYDVDGTCSTALLYMFLKELGANVEFYIPRRLNEGYGLSIDGVDAIKELNNARLLITVDCGITAIEETEYANKLGMDVIICDHHQPKDELPKALAVLDPLKPQCNYPFNYLSGAGVAFKLAQGISEIIGKRELPLKYLDLVALAGAADIVPLMDENRILVKEGLESINNNPRPGIQALIESSSLQLGNLNSGQVVFTLAPRINAVGRLGDAKRAVELLITNSIETARNLAKVLETENYERRKIDVDTFDNALQLVENSIDFDNELAIVLHQEEWHPGVIGIVASRLVEKYYRPTIMLTTIDGIAKGSARSITNFNIYDALQKCDPGQFDETRIRGQAPLEVGRVPATQDLSLTAQHQPLVSPLQEGQTIRLETETSLPTGQLDGARRPEGARLPGQTRHIDAVLPRLDPVGRRETKLVEAQHLPVELRHQNAT